MKQIFAHLLAGVAVVATSMTANAQSAAYSFSPEQGSTVETLEEIQVTVSGGSFEMALDYLQNASLVTIKNVDTNTEVTDVTVTLKGDFNNYKLMHVKFSPAISEPGYYQITFKPGSIVLDDGDGNYSNLTEYNLPVGYEVTGVQGPIVVPPATYDMEMTYTSSKTIDISDEMYAGNISLPTDAKLVNNGKALLFNNSVAYVEEVPIMVFNPGMGNMALVQFGQVSKPVYNGEYTLKIAKGTFADQAYIESNGETGVANDAFEVVLTMTGGKEDPNAGGDQEENVEYTLEYSDVTGNSNPMDVAAGILSPVSVRYPLGTQMVPGAKAKFINTEVGYEKEIEVTIFSGTLLNADYDQALFKINNIEKEDLPEVKGTYSIVVPQGIFGDAEYISSEYKKGVANAGFVIPVIIENSRGDNTDDAKIQTIVYAPTDEILANGQEWAAWAADSKILFNTSNDMAVGYIHMTVTDKNAINPAESLVRTLESRARRTLPENRGVYWQDDEVPFLQLGSIGVEFLEGHEYEIKGEIYDFETPPYSRTLLDEFSFTVTGTTPGYPYALDIKLESVTPDPATYVIQNPDMRSFTLTFNDQVKVAKAVVPAQGGGNALPVESCIEYSDDHKSFVFTFPLSDVLSSTDAVSIQLFITDMEGNSLWWGSDTKENSYYFIEVPCYLGSPDLTVTPESGVVTEIKSLEISCPNGPAGGMINYSYFGGIEVTDLSGDRVFATFPTDYVTLETKKNKDGDYPVKLGISLKEPITTPGLYVVHIKGATFNMGSEFDHATSKDTFLTYTIEGEIADNTVYDFQPESTEYTFNEGLTVATVTLHFPDTVEINPDVINTVELKDIDGNVLTGAQIENSFDLEDYKLWKLNVKYDYAEATKYIVSVPQGTFGNSLWGSDAYYTQYHEGRANAAFDVVINTAIMGVDAIDAEQGEAEYFNLQGVRVENPAEGIYVRVLNGNASKVMIRK